MSLAKADFHDIYNQPDATAYYQTLGALDYEIPQQGADVFEKVIAAHPGDEPPTVLDVCCSYGVGGVLLKTDLRLDALYEHYHDAAAAGLRGAELVQADAELIEQHLLPEPPRVLGLDVAALAADYAVRSDCLDAAFVEDLEHAAPSAELVSELENVDLITTTGGIGYVTERTFNELLDATPETPWVAAFCLRAYDFSPIADSLAERGLVTEQSPHSYPQRRFADADEQRWATQRIVASGLDPAGLESTGRYFADFYLARPAEEVEKAPLVALL